MTDRKAMSRGVKVFVYRVCEVCEEPEAGDVFLTWFVGFLMRNGYGFAVDELDSSVVVYEVVRGRIKVPHDVFDFVVREGWYIAYAAYLIGAYVEVSVCSWDEAECVNLYLSDIRRMERDELPIVGEGGYE